MRHSLFILAIAACGSSQPTATKGTIDGTSARTSIGSVHDVVSAMASNNPSSAASAVLALTAAGESVVVAAPTKLELPHPPITAKPAGEAFTGTATCTATSCTFMNFGDSDQYGSYSINGTISDNNGVLAFDLTYDLTTANLTFHWELDGQVTVDATHIDGNVHSHGDANGSDQSGSFAVTWDIAVDYRNIGLDASGCPISGSLAATVQFTAQNNGSGGSYDVAGTAAFGPACGQVTAE